MDFDERAFEVLFNEGDESLLTEGEIYELYDTVTEIINDRKPLKKHTLH